ncbi:hypothetical protein BH11VER1_BH11VER1_30850 [soil metagenome]
MRIHQTLEHQIKKIRLHPCAKQLMESLLSQHLARSKDGRWKPFFTMIRWRFGKSAEAYLHSIHYQG